MHIWYKWCDGDEKKDEGIKIPYEEPSEHLSVAPTRG